MKKRISLILAIVMVLSLLATTAFADEPDPETEPSPAVETSEPTDVPAPSEEPEPSEAPEPSDEPEPTPEPVPLTGIALSDTKLTLKAGESRALAVRLSPENATDVPQTVWTSSDAAVARVDAAGRVTAVGRGAAVITAQVGTFRASCSVTVRFSDVAEGSFYYDAVYWAMDKKVTSGTTDATFSPDSGCTRAQAVTFLWRINGAPANGAAHPFTDVPAGEYYAAAVRWAYQNGIVRGTSATTFSPDSVCTRGQIISMIWRCRRPAATQPSGFYDVIPGSYYYIPVKWAVAAGVTKGTGGGAFSPNSVCTRAEIVTMLHRCDAGKHAIYDPNAAVPYPRAAALLDIIGWDLKAAFDWSTRLTYYRDNIDISAGAEVLSDYGFTYLKGDCYVYAATFYTMAIDMGYDAHMVWGYVPSSDGSRATHAWTEINMDGTIYVFDSNFTFRTHRSGYMIYYGMTGTWRYVDYHRVN